VAWESLIDGPAPVGVGWRGIGDTGQFSQRDLLSLPHSERREFLIGRTSIGRHHTMVNISQPRSTRHSAGDLTSYAGPTFVMFSHVK
jgi:hypothetical protein